MKFETYKMLINTKSATIVCRGLEIEGIKQFLTENLRGYMIVKYPFRKSYKIEFHFNMKYKFDRMPCRTLCVHMKDVRLSSNHKYEYLAVLSESEILHYCDFLFNLYSELKCNRLEFMGDETVYNMFVERHSVLSQNYISKDELITL